MQTITQEQLNEWLGQMDEDLLRELLYDVVTNNFRAADVIADVLAYADTIQEGA